MQENPPVKYIKAKNSKPSSTRYVFCPNLFGKIQDSVLKIEWNIISYKVNLVIKETPKMDVYKWIKYTIKQNHDVEKSPFVNIDNNYALLEILDENEVKIVTIKFKNLSMKSHKCCFSKLHSSCTNNGHDFLSHELEFNYQEIEEIYQKEKTEDIQTYDEWQTVETLS